MNDSSAGRRLPHWLDRSLMMDAFCLLVLVIYFLHFALPALAGGFADDEMMNLWIDWWRGLPGSVWATACFWRGAGRPMGAFYYLPLYYGFALNPQPYRIAQIGILTISIPIVYYLARLLAGSRPVAFLAALAVSYHARLVNLVFVGSFIYDVFCGLFYFAALAWYLHIRRKGSPLNLWQTLGFLTLYVCALASKEMAITLPVIVFLYEVFNLRPWQNWRQVSRRDWRFVAPSLIAAVLTIPNTYAKVRSTHVEASLTAYRPEISWERFVGSNSHFIDELSYHSIPTHVLTGATVLVWAIALAYALWRRDRWVLLMAIWVVIIPLPLAFVLPARGGACLYLLLFGWAMILADFITKLVDILIAKTSMFFGKRIVKAPGGNAARMLPQLLRVFAIALAAVGLGLLTQWENQRSGRIPAILKFGQKSLHVIQAFRALNIQPAHGSTILLKPEKPFYQNKFYPMFVASLVWNDHSLQIYVAGQHQLSEQEIAKMNYVISFTEFEAKLEPNSG